jgi:subtilisin family serine protease
VPEGHGQAVALVLARGLQQAGRRPVLHAADLGCGQGAVDAIATALQALDAERVPVVNVSAVGPYNRVMAAVVAAFLARGHLLVAAVGNDGPAAPPLYPAAYPGVIAVTAVDRQGRVLVEAGRGEHVAFAAPGIVELPGPDGTTRTWRGTSLAAPVVAAALALRLRQPDPAAAQAAVAQLARNALDAGEPGRDRIYGHGIVGLPATALAAVH